MARETESERTLKKSNQYYRKLGEARITKNDPHVRFFGKKAIFAASSGLDYSGIIKGGKHISFEVKQTERPSLPLGNIRMSQLDIMQQEQEFGADSFLLVYFKKYKEWYRLNFDDLKRATDKGFASLPLRFFRAFGFLIPSHLGFPLYLSPEAYPTRNILRKDYPSWMPKIRTRKPPEQIVSPDPTNMEARKRRIMNATRRGIKSAQRREIQIEQIKNRRGLYNNGTKGRHTFED